MRRVHGPTEHDPWHSSHLWTTDDTIDQLSRLMWFLYTAVIEPCSTDSRRTRDRPGREGRRNTVTPSIVRFFLCPFRHACFLMRFFRARIPFFSHSPMVIRVWFHLGMSHLLWIGYHDRVQGIVHRTMQLVDSPRLIHGPTVVSRYSSLARKLQTSHPPNGDAAVLVHLMLPQFLLPLNDRPTETWWPWHASPHWNNIFCRSRSVQAHHADRRTKTSAA